MRNMPIFTCQRYARKDIVILIVLYKIIQLSFSFIQIIEKECLLICRTYDTQVCTTINNNRFEFCAILHLNYEPACPPVFFFSNKFF